MRIYCKPHRVLESNGSPVHISRAPENTATLKFDLIKVIPNEMHLVVYDPLLSCFETVISCIQLHIIGYNMWNFRWMTKKRDSPFITVINCLFHVKRSVPLDKIVGRQFWWSWGPGMGQDQRPGRAFMMAINTEGERYMIATTHLRVPV